jgi:ADP-ribose pyrophosphatase YjhB (NUDIX family)
MVRRIAFSIVSKLALQPWFRLTRGQTLGVRAVVRDGDGAFLLVRHTYVPGWTFPGGGVDRLETLEAALVRELREEVAVVPSERPRLFGVYANHDRFKGDHVALFLVDEWSRTGTAPASLEIAEYGFFAADALPHGTTGGTLRRVREVLAGATPDADW